MKLYPLCLLFCLSLLTAVGFARSGSKNKGKLEKSPSIAAEADVNGNTQKAASQETSEQSQSGPGDQTGANSGSSGKRRGSKRQKKTEKRKKFKKGDKAERDSIDTPDSDDENEMESLPSPPQKESPAIGGKEEPGLVENAFNQLSRLALSGEATNSYRSEKLPCSDRLNRQLMTFYEENVRLQPANVETAVEIVEQFMQTLFPHIEMNFSDLKFSGFRLVGSMSEDLAASELSDFDFHLPLHVGKSQLKAVKIPNIPGYSHISCTKSSLCDKFSVPGKPLLSPQRIISELQSIVQKTIAGNKLPMIHGCSKYRPGYKGPTVSIELDCTVDGHDKSLRVELVPLITTSEETKFVAKAADMNFEKVHPHSWRKSFTDQERALLATKSGDELHVLRLMKAMVKDKRLALNYLSSYKLKNVYFHMEKKAYPWQSKTLCDQLIDFLDHLHTYAKDKNLPLHFQENINLFSSVPRPDTIINLEGRLKKILDAPETNLKKWIGIEEPKDEL